MKRPRVFQKVDMSRLLLNRATIKDDNCWLWTRTVDGRGYGIIRHQGKLEKVHRLAALFCLNFDLNSDLHVLHKLICKHKNCFNPDHLYVGTHDDNMSDRIRAKTHCNHGHEFTPENTYITHGARE